VAASAIGHEHLVSKVAHVDDLDDEVGKSVEQVLPPAAGSGVAVIVALIPAKSETASTRQRPSIRERHRDPVG